MTQSTILRLRKDEDRRIRAGHVWVFSNEIDVRTTPLAGIEPGSIVDVHDSRGHFLGRGYVNPASLISVRLLTRDPRQPIDAAFLRGRIASAYRLREGLFGGDPFYRLVFSEGDGLPGLVVDRFGEYLVVQPNTAGIEAMLDTIVGLLVEVTGPSGVLVRADSSAREYEGLTAYTREAHGSVPEVVPIVENGVRFDVPVVGGQKTGWFYDHRENRGRLRRYAPGARVLDVFSYTGGWGVQAATFGAREVVCVDSSASALDGVRRNAEINNVADRVDVRRGDAFGQLAAAATAGERFDVVVLDPPAFIKRRKDVREGQRAYQRLSRLGMELVADGGILVAASCSFHMERDALLRTVLRAATEAGRDVQLVQEGHQGPDHPVHLAIPETNYLKALFVRTI